LLRIIAHAYQTHVPQPQEKGPGMTDITAIPADALAGMQRYRRWLA
jgi:hypothetical protein